MSGLKVNDFFCGCGGMGLAFQKAGFEIAGAWDYDKHAVQSYRENVGNHVQKADIREMKWSDIPRADVWAFGFPCQDLSVAGGEERYGYKVPRLRMRTGNRAGGIRWEQPMPGVRRKQYQGRQPERMLF